MAVATRGKGMGMGDVKLALFVGFALGLTIGIKCTARHRASRRRICGVLMLIRIRKRQDIMPYGPFISVARSPAVLAGCRVGAAAECRLAGRVRRADGDPRISPSRGDGHRRRLPHPLVRPRHERRLGRDGGHAGGGR